MSLDEIRSLVVPPRLRESRGASIRSGPLRPKLWWGPPASMWHRPKLTQWQANGGGLHQFQAAAANVCGGGGGEPVSARCLAISICSPSMHEAVPLWGGATDMPVRRFACMRFGTIKNTSSMLRRFAPRCPSNKSKVCGNCRHSSKCRGRWSRNSTCLAGFNRRFEVADFTPGGIESTVFLFLSLIQGFHLRHATAATEVGNPHWQVGRSKRTPSTSCAELPLSQELQLLPPPDASP